MPALAEPVLTLALGNLEKLSSINSQMSTIWGVFTKCKDNLENGHRLENLSWRLWYRSCNSTSSEKDCKSVLTKPMENSFKEKDFQLQVIQKLEKTLDTSDLLLQTIESEIINTEDPQQQNVPKMENLVPLTVATPIDSISLEERVKIVERQRRNLSFLQEKLQQNIKLHQPSKSVPASKVSLKNLEQNSSTANENFNVAAVEILSTKENTRSLVAPKTTFFIGATDSDSNYTSETDEDFDSGSDCSSESDISDSDDFVAAKVSKLFAKSNLNLTNKRPSLLSIGLQRNQFRKIQSDINMPAKNEQKEDVVDLSQIDMSASLLQNLHLDHFKGFNTTRNERGKDQAQVTYSLDYW